MQDTIVMILLFDSSFSQRRTIRCNNNNFTKDLPSTERREQPTGPTETDTAELGKNPEPNMVRIVLSSQDPESEKFK